MTTKAQRRKQQAEELQAKLTHHIENLTTSQQWKTTLDAMRHFHGYSPRNFWLIRSQCSDATFVAGYRKWTTLGRQVRKGEKAIKIFGYRTYTTTEENEDGEEVTTKRAYYPILNVFDVSQTDVIDGHNATIPNHLTGDDEHSIYARAEAYAQQLGWTVDKNPIAGAANGYTTLDGSYTIAIDSNLSDAQAAKTLLHELAHVILHTKDGKALDDDVNRRVQEVEAESTAYVVAGLLGLDTENYTVGYVAGWAGGDVEQVKQTAERVLKASHQLADALEKTTEEEENTPEAANEPISA